MFLICFPLAALLCSGTLHLLVDVGSSSSEGAFGGSSCSGADLMGCCSGGGFVGVLVEVYLVVL